MITLTVQREKTSWYNKQTILKDRQGKTKAIILSNLRQPRYGQKTIIINCFTYLLDWSGVIQTK